MKVRCWRAYKTRERRASIKAAREQRLRHERFERETRQRCIDKGGDPNCPFQRLAAAWELAADSWENAATAWGKVI